MKRVKYLNNRDLLAQIYASKNTFCSYVTPEDGRYDLIISDVKKINAITIAKARKAQSKRLTQEAWEQAKASGLKKIKLSVDVLKEKLKSAIEKEEYEIAAKLRDKISEMES